MAVRELCMSNSQKDTQFMFMYMACFLLFCLPACSPDYLFIAVATFVPAIAYMPVADGLQRWLAVEGASNFGSVWSHVDADCLRALRKLRIFPSPVANADTSVNTAAV